MLESEKRDCSMPRILTLVIVLVAIIMVPCLADQLAWNSRATCEEAAKSIQQNAILLSYCSLCNNEHVEVWLVKGIIVAPTAVQGLFELSVLGKRLYTSKEVFQGNQHWEPIPYEAFMKEGSLRWFAAAIDLAYVYVPMDEGTFRCLGKIIKRKCIINVNTISLPRQILEEAKRKVWIESKKEMLTW